LSITDGDVGVLFASPVSISMWVGAAAVVIVPQIMRRMRKAKKLAAGPA
jgi:putative tricarboxylic transport membrane protein